MTNHEKRIEAIASKMADYFKEKEWLVIDAPRMKEVLEASGITREVEELRAEVALFREYYEAQSEFRGLTGSGGWNESATKAAERLEASQKAIGLFFKREK